MDDPFVFRIEPGTHVCLDEYDTRYKAGLSRKQGEEMTEALTEELEELQELLYATGTHSVLIVLQGMDTSGKDGTVRNVLRDVSPIGCRIQPFKVPTEEELAHDFLWRVHKVVPKAGEMVVFNRSHYEDVLVVRVKQLVPEEVWSLRYRQINDFERLLAEHNTLMVKIFLHISHEEQEERLRQREESVRKAWKLAPGDWRDRALWDDYQRAYEDALRECNTPYAPWHIVPADRKWFRNLAVAHTLVETLRPLKANWMDQLREMQAQALQELDEVRERTG